MDRQGVRVFLREVMGQGAELEDQGEWVMGHCPFAPWKHDSGRDRNASFGMHVDPHGPSGFNCFTCKTKGGSAVDFAMELYRLTQDDYYLDMADGVDGIETYGGPLPQYDQIINWVQQHLILDEPLGREYLDIYDPAPDHPYLEQRGISPETAEELFIMVDSNDHGSERIVFPVFSPDGGLHGFSGRAVLDNVRPKVRDYPGLKKQLLLLGSHQLEDADCIMLVEGLFDYALMYEYGYYVVAALHSGLTQEQANILIGIGKPIYLFYDQDVAGVQGAVVARGLLAPHIPVLHMYYNRNQGDPGRCHQDDVERMIQNAVLL